MNYTHKGSWVIQCLPELSATLDYRREFSVEELKMIARGYIPQQMEDKWFIFLEDTTLYLHRSWTGICIYKVELQEITNGWTVRQAWINCNPDQYKRKDDCHESEKLDRLISFLIMDEGRG